MRAYFIALRLPLAITLGVFVAAVALDGVVPGSDLVLYVVMAQIFAMVMAGNHIVVYRLGGLVQAALAAGAIVFIVDVTLGVARFGVMALLADDEADWGRQALGLLAAFVIFAPAMLFFGYLGGVNGRRELHRG